jgi:Protein of unknown function (DUF2946)
MNWIRLKIRSGARLALFALAFQMAVSFGHMHRDDLGLPPLPSADSAPAASAATPADPANSNHHPASSDDYCPICASMQLIATALPSLPPVLWAPEPIRRVWLAQTPAQIFSPRIALSFRARGPPAA